MTAPISIRYEDWVAVIEDANKAQERVKKLEVALKWYARPETYWEIAPGYIGATSIEIDHGDRAREALEE